MPGQVITFYSYKGGVGRSFLLANVAALMAMWGHKVLCVDWDLEAPGLNHYFAPWLQDKNKPGIVDHVTQFIEQRKSHSWGRLLSKVEIPDARGSLHFISAGTPDADYVPRAQAINWKAAYTELGLGNEIELMRAEWKDYYDFVLIDSRTGISDLAGVCTIQLPDLFVFLFTANQQSIEGASGAAQRVLDTRSAFPIDREQLLCLPVLSRFAQDKEYDLATHWMNLACSAVGDSYRPWLNQKIDVASFVRMTRIPEMAYWTFGERLPVILEKENFSDPQSISYPILNIAALLVKNLSGSDQLMLQRESFIAGAQKVRRTAKAPGSQTSLLPIFISAASDPMSQRFMQEIKAMSEDFGLKVINEEEVSDKDWRQATLAKLHEARYLVVLVGDEMGSWQHAEIESFFSLSFREKSAGGILPVLLTKGADQAIPPILRSMQFIDGRGHQAEDLLAAISARTTTDTPSA
jgi:MinD-like ATPase involved in chromosome partitioning or flagellar assembly